MAEQAVRRQALEEVAEFFFKEAEHERKKKKSSDNNSEAGKHLRKIQYNQAALCGMAQKFPLSPEFLDRVALYYIEMYAMYAQNVLKIEFLGEYRTAISLVICGGSPKVAEAALKQAVQDGYECDAEKLAAYLNRPLTEREVWIIARSYTESDLYSSKDTEERLAKFVKKQLGERARKQFLGLVRAKARRWSYFID